MKFYVNELKPDPMQKSKGFIRLTGSSIHTHTHTHTLTCPRINLTSLNHTRPNVINHSFWHDKGNWMQKVVYKHLVVSSYSHLECVDLHKHTRKPTTKDSGKVDHILSNELYFLSPASFPKQKPRIHCTLSTGRTETCNHIS